MCSQTSKRIKNDGSSRMTKRIKFQPRWFWKGILADSCSRISEDRAFGVVWEGLGLREPSVSVVLDEMEKQARVYKNWCFVVRVGNCSTRSTESLYEVAEHLCPLIVCQSVLLFRRFQQFSEQQHKQFRFVHLYSSRVCLFEAVYHEDTPTWKTCLELRRPLPPCVLKIWEQTRPWKWPESADASFADRFFFLLNKLAGILLWLENSVCQADEHAGMFCESFVLFQWRNKHMTHNPMLVSKLGSQIFFCDRNSKFMRCQVRHIFRNNKSPDIFWRTQNTLVKQLQWTSCFFRLTFGSFFSSRPQLLHQE